MGSVLRPRELLESLIEWRDLMRARASSETAEVVVEGPRDKEALSLLGIRANYTYAGSLLRDLRELGEGRVKGKTFIIMTDFDKEGIKINEKLKIILTQYGGNLDDGPRNEYLRRGFPTLIEELRGFLERRFPDWDLIVSSHSD
jgi:5S rRNA maturation endonuclease (ribonuclease M5)